MRWVGSILSVGVMGAMIGIGCRPAQPLPPTPVPSADNPDLRRVEEQPLPPPRQAGGARTRLPGLEDEPASDPPAESKEFVAAYREVGKPHIVVFVNRTLEGDILLVGDGKRQDVPKANEPPASRPEGLDYQALENVLRDELGCGGEVTILSATAGDKKLTEAQLKDLQSGKPEAGKTVARQLDADILVQVQAHPLRRIAEGRELRVVAEAINLPGGPSLAHAQTTSATPLDAPGITQLGRFLSRRMMAGMRETWAKGQPEGRDAQAPTTRPLDMRP